MKENNTINKKRIFIIDDDVAIRDVLACILEGEQYEAESFASGKTALQQIEEKKPDLVLLDYYLPDESAEEIIEALRGRVDTDLPILLMSAHLKASEVAQRFELKDFLAKPFQLEAVLQAVREGLC
jgi:two-component system phosphate regulon response regulator PhoB